MWASSRRTIALLASVTVCQFCTSRNVGAAPFAYIANTDSGSVSVIDLATDTAVDTVPMGQKPYAITVNRAGTKVYTADVNNSNMYALDTASRVVTPIPIPQASGAMRGVAVNPMGTRVYVPNVFAPELWVVDAETNVVMTPSIALPGAGHRGLAVGPGGSRVYVAAQCLPPNCTAGGLAVVDAINRTVVGSVPVAPSAHYVAVSPSGTRVYVSSESDGVSVVDATTNTLVTTISGSPDGWGIAVNPILPRVYVANRCCDTITVINTDTNTIATTFSVGPAPTGLSVNRQGTKVYVTIGTGRVAVLDASTGAPITSIPVRSNPLSIGQFISPACYGDADCSDGDLCDGVEQCLGEDCAPGSAPNCDDDDECTDDGCDAVAGCTHAPASGCVPAFTAAARKCQTALARGGMRFVATAHRMLSSCLDSVLIQGADAAARCAASADPANPASRLARARAKAERQVTTKCAGVTPDDINAPCDLEAATMTDTIRCVLDQHGESLQRMIAAEYRDACAMLPAVGLGGAFPNICSMP